MLHSNQNQAQTVPQQLRSTTGPPFPQPTVRPARKGTEGAPPRSSGRGRNHRRRRDHGRLQDSAQLAVEDSVAAQRARRLRQIAVVGVEHLALQPQLGQQELHLGRRACGPRWPGHPRAAAAAVPVLLRPARLERAAA